jgi:hypothetical protein
MIKRLLKIARVALPLLLALVAGAIKLRAGQYGLPLALVMSAGVLLGWAAALALESVATLVGDLSDRTAVAPRTLLQLEQEKETLLRSIKELEFDAALQKLDGEESARLSEPLRQRALALLRELDHARQSPAATVEEQIERELARRLGRAAAKEPEGGAA